MTPSTRMCKVIEVIGNELPNVMAACASDPSGDFAKLVAKNMDDQGDNRLQLLIIASACLFGVAAIDAATEAANA